MTVRCKMWLVSLPLCLCAILPMATSCDDIYDTDSDRQVFNPKIDAPIDSMYYTLGILKSVQQAIDGNVIVNELRGDLVGINENTTTPLRELYNFSAGANSKYDSAYVYYRIINNCNYYVHHRDTTLLIGSRKIAMPEYAEALAVRAWTYIQLARNYGRVPFYTTPLSYVSEADKITTTADIYQICDSLAPELEKFSHIAVPNYGTINAYRTNAGQAKNVASARMMFPVDLVLGDLYLEANRYKEAADHYFRYIKDQQIVVGNRRAGVGNYPDETVIPEDFAEYNAILYTDNWDANFTMNGPYQTWTYVPMAVNYLEGVPTVLPSLFGYNIYHSTALEGEYDGKTQLGPSEAYLKLSQYQPYYYSSQSEAGEDFGNVIDLGDMRFYDTFTNVRYTDPTNPSNQYTYYSMKKFNGSNIPIYRTATIYLKLAEALNRMGYPDAAFAILKDGVGTNAIVDSTYIRPETDSLFTYTIPFFSVENRNVFYNSYGIHGYGSGDVIGAASLYQYQPVINAKLDSLHAMYGIERPDSLEPYSAQAIDCVEDLICDEFALESAFEGTRYGDLLRFARHKNNDSPYGADWGSRWLAGKLAFKHPVVDLTDPKNWYLPLR